MTHTLLSTSTSSEVTEGRDFWVENAWTEETLQVLKEYLTPSNKDGFHQAWIEFIELASLTNPAWLPPKEYSVAVAEILAELHDHGREGEANKGKASQVFFRHLPVASGVDVSDLDNKVLVSASAGASYAAYLTNESLNEKIVAALAEVLYRQAKKNPASLFNYNQAVSWLNIINHPNCNADTLGFIARKVIPTYRTLESPYFQAAAKVDAVTQRTEASMDGIFAGSTLGAPDFWKEQKAEPDYLPHSSFWEHGAGEYLASAALARDDLGWFSRARLSLLGYKAGRTVRKDEHSPTRAQMFVAGMWDGTDWDYLVDDLLVNRSMYLNDNDFVAAEPQHGGIYAPVVPGRSDLAVHLLPKIFSWLGNQETTRGTHRKGLNSKYRALTFPYLGGALALIRREASRQGFENAENLPLEWLLEFVDVKSWAGASQVGDAASEPAVYNQEAATKDGLHSLLVSIYRNSENQDFKRNLHWNVPYIKAAIRLQKEALKRGRDA